MGQKNPTENQQLESQMSSIEMRRRYLRLLKEIEYDYPFFSKMFYNSGYPVFTSSKSICPTSMMRADRFTDDIVYYWNSEFFNKMTDNQVKFIIAHETFHVLLDHLTIISEIEYPKIYNMACDAVINDLLLKQFNFDMFEDMLTGEKLVGFNCADKSAEFVYRHLLINAIQMPSYMQMDVEVEGHQVPGDGSGSGKGKSESEDSEDEKDGKDGDKPEEKEGDQEKAKPLDNHGHWSEEEGQELADRIPFAFDVQTGSLIQTKGLGAGNLKYTLEDLKNNFSIANLVKNIIAKRKEEEQLENWKKYPYKISSVYPEVVLPYTDENEMNGRLSLLFCLDTSGSVPAQVCQEFVAIAKNHMNDFDVEALTFDDGVYPLDLKKDVNYRGGGGTSFQKLAEYVVKQKMEEYDAIIVFTDGWGGDIGLTLTSKKWFWLITPNGSEVDVSKGASHRIPDDYIKGYN